MTLQHADRSDEQRVVVTGMGSVTPLGEDVAAMTDALFAGRSGIGRWNRGWDDCLCQIGGDLSAFSLKEHLKSHSYPEQYLRPLKKLLRASHLASVVTPIAALQAWVESGLHESKLAPERVGQVCAAHNVCIPYIAEGLAQYAEEPEYIEPLFGMMALDTDVVAVTSELLGTLGPTFLVGGACASGNIAVIRALDLIRVGRADAVVVSGSPIALDPAALQGWAIIQALSYRSFNDDPAAASRPFDTRREGFVPSEGAAAVVLESLASAKRRGATILGEILGGASASDATRATRPNQEGQERSMRLALADARIDADEVDYINAHATSTPIGDAVEIAAIRAVLGPRAATVPVNATKSMVGHCLTAAGVVELVATLIQMRHQRLHPTINHDNPDPELDIDCVPNVARDCVVNVAMSNSFGFGGLNSCIVVGAVRGG